LSRWATGFAFFVAFELAVLAAGLEEALGLEEELEGVDLEDFEDFE
jgi:hypothetical protein